jgi:hypothetical protein
VRNKRTAPESSCKEPSGQSRSNRIADYKHEKGSWVNGNFCIRPTRPAKSFQLLQLILRRSGSDEIIYSPPRNRCGFPILDFKMANISVWDRDDFKLTPLGWQEETGCHVFLAKGDVYAFHKECDNSPSGSAWTNADNIFKSDQRHAFERRWEGEARSKSAQSVPSQHREGQQAL